MMGIHSGAEEDVRYLPGHTLTPRPFLRHGETRVVAEAVRKSLVGSDVAAMIFEYEDSNVGQAAKEFEGAEMVAVDMGSSRVCVLDNGGQ